MREGTRWQGYVSTDPVGLHALVGQGLILLGQDLHDELSPAMEQYTGVPDWPRVVSAELRTGDPKAMPIARYDVTSWKRLLERNWPGRPSLRDAFGHERYRLCDPLLGNLGDIRNAHAHPDELLSVATAREALAKMHELATQAKFACSSSLHEMVNALEERSSGRAVVVPSEDEVRRQTELAVASARQAREAEEAKQQAEEAVEAAQDRAKEAEQAQREAEAEADRLRKEMRDLADQAERADATARTQLDHELARLTEERRAAQDRAERMESDRARLQAELAKRREEQDAALATHEELERRVDQLSSELTRAQAAAADFRQTALADTIRETQRRVRQMQRIPSMSLPADGGKPILPQPGQPWADRRGDEVWTLPIQGQMFRREDGFTLEQLVGKDRAVELTSQFRKIRPSGGRVWVDEDMDACTYTGGKLVYLGRLRSAQEAGPAEPALGSALGDFKGQRYDVSTTGITHRPTGASLETYVGREISAAVQARLLRVRPKGGTYRVDRSGVVATWVDGDWVYAGTVRAHEWFPGHLG